MSLPSLPSDVIRFVLTSIPSVPHLEAMLLLRQDAGIKWEAKEVGHRLYIPEKKAEALLHDLTEARILVCDDGTSTYRYLPASAELYELIDKLADVYAKNIVEVSNLIHSKADNHVQQFADAFKLRKDS
ncbi:MAG TPA: hypothetical protein VIF82_17100 [Burkholderiaceae bacterium]|jgi:hypothetical protein